jgi:hypothetical protein
MSVISDFKSAPFDIFNQYTGTGSNGIPDTSNATLLGVRFNTNDGRQVALASVGATAITQGVLTQCQAQVTAFQKLAITVPSTTPATAGTNQILVTNGATVLNINQFAGGNLVVASGTGIGQTLNIASHQPAAASGTFLVTLQDPIQVTLSASSTVSLLPNQFSNIIINPTTATGSICGVTLYALTASTAPTYNATTGALVTAGVPQYGWVVTKGSVGCLSDSSITAVGASTVASTTTAGCVTSATGTDAVVGVSAQTQTSAQVGLINVNL